MDWINKLEEERRSKSEAEVDSDWSHINADERFRDRVAKRLLPVIDETISRLKEKTGVLLTAELSDTEVYRTQQQGGRYRTAAIVVVALHAGEQPSRDESLERLNFRFNEIVPATALRESSIGSGLHRTGNHYFVISQLSDDGQTVRIEAQEDWRIERGELPDDMSPRDWYGPEETYVMRNDLENLIALDIQILLEWLVRTETSIRSIGPPLTSGVLHEQNEHNSAKRSAWLGLAAAIVAFPGALIFEWFIFLAPVGIFLGIRAHRNKHLTGSSKYYEASYAAETGAKWAIGLGAFGTLILIIALIRLASFGSAPRSTASDSSKSGSDEWTEVNDHDKTRFAIKLGMWFELAHRDSFPVRIFLDDGSEYLGLPKPEQFKGGMKTDTLKRAAGKKAVSATSGQTFEGYTPVKDLGTIPANNPDLAYIYVMAMPGQTTAVRVNTKPK